MTSLYETAARICDQFIAQTAQGIEDIAGRFVIPKAFVVRQVSETTFDVEQVAANDSTSLSIVIGSPETSVPSADMQAALKGARVELVLLAESFLIKDMTLPAQAGSFVQKIISNQIDRISPWTSDCAIFGFVERGLVGSKLFVTVAVTDKRRIAAILDFVSDCRPRVLHIVTASPGTGILPIPIAAPLGMGSPKAPALRRALAMALMVTWGVVAVDQIYAAWMSGRYESQTQALNTEFEQRRNRLLSPGVMSDESRRLLMRKMTGPVATLLLEDLVSLLPDDTYLTEFELDGSKLRMAGTSLDATRLIGLLERSGRVSNVAFYAPTTRSRSNPGERFFIEAAVRERVGGKS